MIYVLELIVQWVGSLVSLFCAFLHFSLCIYMLLQLGPDEKELTDVLDDQEIQKDYPDTRRTQKDVPDK